MKKFPLTLKLRRAGILPILILFIASIFLFNSYAHAKTDAECRPVFDQDMKKCTENFNACIYSCGEETKKPDGTVYFNSGEIYSRCTKREQCTEKSSACNAKALEDFWACRKSDKKPKEAKKEAPNQTLPIFIGEWFSRFSEAIDGLISLPGAFEAVLDNKFYIAPDIPDITELTLEEMFQGHWYPDKDEEDSYRPPTLTTEEEQRAWSFLPNYIPGEENVTLIKGQGEIKTPTSSDFIQILPKGGDTLQATYLDSTMRSTSDMVQLGYTWSADSGSVISAPEWSEIKFRKPVEVEGFTSHTVELGQGEIEVRVRNNKPAENQFGVDAGWLGVTVSRTHFWISQSKDKKLAVIGVYEGEVEVKTKDGQTVKVKPDGGKQGVVVVSRQLSVTKLAVASVVIITVAIGIAWYIKKRKKK
ncbi:FecR domain-containing protein [Candidatus Daviesbacteria bacterium]|nr:FecR domain-containing protein [Candidatus Daviesbacteria bacterium]